MARIHFPDKRSKEVPDESALTEACIEMGIPIMNGCLRGICGGCRSTVVEGVENIQRVSACGSNYLGENEVLLCQTQITKGDITIEW